MSLTIRGTRIPKRLIATTLLFLFSVCLAVFLPSPSRILCVAAMLLSSLGDILLMDFRPITRQLPFRGFIAGAVCFSVSHVVYAGAFLLLFVGKETPLLPGLLTGGILFISMTALLAAITFGQNGDRKMFGLETLYLFVICLNIASSAWAAATVGGITWLSPVGGCFFLFSDMFILTQTVRRQSAERFKVPIWITYVTAQILLLVGA